MTWGRFLTIFLAVLVIAGGGLLAAVLVVDPYDTGRFTPLDWHGVPDNSPRLVTASLARNPDVDSAIVGDSSIQLLDPRRLAALTRHRFVQLSIAGTGPVEQVEVIGWFRRHHADAKAIVVGLTASWCTAGFRFVRGSIANPFPFWLYSASGWEYLGSVPSLRSLRDSVRRIGMLRGAVPVLDPLRVDDYERGRTYDLATARERLYATKVRRPLPDPLDDGAGPGIAGRAPSVDAASALDHLAPALADFGPETHKILLFVPAHAVLLPRAGSAAARDLADCKAKAQHLAGTIPNTVAIDFLRDAPLNRTDENYWDGLHFRHPVAEAIEQAIAVALAGKDVSVPIDRALEATALSAVGR